MLVMWTMYCFVVRDIGFRCEEGLGIHSFVLNGLAMTVFLLQVVLLSIDDSLEWLLLGWLDIFYWLNGG